MDKTCLICGSKKHFQREGRLRDKPHIKVLECSECSLVFLDNDDIESSFYINGNMHNSGNAYELSQKTDYINDQFTINRQRLEFVLDKIIGRDILDFGSGYAGFLLQAKRYAKSVAGIELEANAKEVYQTNNICLFSNLEEALRDCEYCGGGVNMTLLVPFM